MAKILIFRCANDALRDYISWQVYHSLASQTARPHTFWRNNQRTMLTAPQPLLLTPQGNPCKFKALMEIHTQQVGVLCTASTPQTIWHGIATLCREGADIIVVGVKCNAHGQISDQRQIFDALTFNGHEVIITPIVIPSIRNYPVHEPNSDLDYFVQQIANAVMDGINELNNQNR